MRWGHPGFSKCAPNPLRSILIKREDTVTEEKACEDGGHIGGLETNPLLHQRKPL